MNSSSKKLLVLLGSAFLIVIVGGGVWYLKGESSAVHSNSAPQSTGVSIDGNHLLYEEAPFIVKGVELLAMLAPAGYKDTPVQTANAHFDATELKAAKTWGVNTIAFSVAQAGFDPQAPLYSSAYLTQVTNAVKLARSMNFVVILHVRDHGNLGTVYGAESNAEGMPDASTLRADETVGKLFSNDLGVIIEPYTEPVLKPTPANWTLWEQGGMGAQGTVVGMQTIITTLRADGVHNILAIDGLDNAKSFEGAPSLTDPLNEFFYAVHPYINALNNTPEIWQNNFGFLADVGKVVVATEWTEPTSNRSPLGNWCQRQSLTIPQTELDFLTSKHIGVVGYAFDVPGTIVSDFNGTPTTYRGKACGDANGGPGEILQQQFKIPTPTF